MDLTHGHTLDELAFLTWLVTDNGYRDIKPIPRGRYAAIRPLAFTHALIVGRIGDLDGYDEGWCYGSYRAAKDALDAWDGLGEPQGWHRHPTSGRRQAADDPAPAFDGQGPLRAPANYYAP